MSSDVIVPTGRTNLTPTSDGLANYNSLTANYFLNRPVRTIWTPTVSGENTGTLVGYGPPAMTAIVYGVISVLIAVVLACLLAMVAYGA